MNESEDRARRAVLHASPSGLAIMMASWLGGAVVGGVAAAAVVGTTKLAWLGVAAGTILGAAIYFAVVRPASFRREITWMERLPYRFSVERYVRALGKKRAQTRVEIVVRFVEPPPASHRKAIRDAGESMYHDVEARMGEALTLRATLTTKKKRPPSSDLSDADPYDNGPVHALVRSVLRDGLPALHADHPIERVAVKLTAPRSAR